MFRESHNKIFSDQYPIFLLPDITGDSTSVAGLGELLSNMLGKRQCVFVWEHPHAGSLQRTLANYVTEIKTRMTTIFDEGPYLVAGFSFGGILAHLVSQQLQAEGNEVACCVIDSPSVEVSKKYLNAENNVDATNDIIAIFDYAVKLAAVKVGQPYASISSCISKEMGVALATNPILQQIAFIGHLIKTQLSPSQEPDPSQEAIPSQETDPSQKVTPLQEAYATYQDAITQNLHNLLSHENTEHSLENVQFIAAESTLKKYESHNLSLEDNWSSYLLNGSNTSNVLDVPTPPINSTHFSLIGDAHRLHVAASMSHFFKPFLIKPWKQENEEGCKVKESRKRKYYDSTPNSVSCTSSSRLFASSSSSVTRRAMTTRYRVKRRFKPINSVK